MPYIEIDIVVGCNLRCNYCSHLSPYRKGYVSIDEILYWFETWSKKIQPNEIRLLGGEPFLHPDLASIIIQSRKIWKTSKLGITTNGLLIRKSNQDVLNALKKSEFTVHISDHSDSETLYKEVIAGATCLKNNEIMHYVWADNKSWYAQHLLDKDNVPIPYKSPPRKAWSVCLSKHHPSLANNQLYKCAVLQSMSEGVREGALKKSAWEDALSYKPLSREDSATTIVEHLLTCEVNACSICADKLYVVSSEQMQ